MVSRGVNRFLLRPNLSSDLWVMPSLVLGTSPPDLGVLLERWRRTGGPLRRGRGMVSTTWSRAESRTRPARGAADAVTWPPSGRRRSGDHRPVQPRPDTGRLPCARRRPASCGCRGNVASDCSPRRRDRLAVGQELAEAAVLRHLYVDEVLVVDPAERAVHWLALVGSEYREVRRSGLIDL